MSHRNRGQLAIVSAKELFSMINATGSAFDSYAKLKILDCSSDVGVGARFSFLNERIQSA